MHFKTLSRKISRLPPKTGQAARKISIDVSEDTGIFTCQIPIDIKSLLGVTADLFDTNLPGLTYKLDGLLEKFERAVQMSVATQVIVVNYRVKCEDNTPFGLRNDFDERATDALPSNIIGFDYEVLFRIDNRLYSQEYEDAPLHYEGPAKTGRNRMLLDWSAETEAMFAEMTVRLERMIDQMNTFFSPDALADNIAVALANQSQPLLISTE